MSNVAAYEKLVERGCKCGTDRPQDCTLHPKPGDNRGLAAFYRAGMPLAFPSPMTCGQCGADGLGYPNVQHAAPGEPTLICPNCSTRANESLLRFRLELEGIHKLNGRTVFGDLRPYPIRDMAALLDRGTPEQQAECIDALRDCWHAREDGSDLTVQFPIGDDGRRQRPDGLHPSYALALLFDHERFMRGESTALVWEAEPEAVAA